MSASGVGEIRFLRVARQHRRFIVTRGPALCGPRFMRHSGMVVTGAGGRPLREFGDDYQANQGGEGNEDDDGKDGVAIPLFSGSLGDSGFGGRPRFTGERQGLSLGDMPVDSSGDGGQQFLVKRHFSGYFPLVPGGSWQVASRGSERGEVFAVVPVLSLGRLIGMIRCISIAQCRQERAKFGELALVPTMGALHEGHVSLITAAKAEAKHVAVSIFVNPTQFGPGEDYLKYPRPIEQDLEICQAAGVDLVFHPEAEEMYPPGSPEIAVDLPQLTSILEGRQRPGHFKGVCHVVAKLFNIIQPQVACFGRKDFQQLRVIEAMVQAMSFPIRIVPCPTHREADGLAMSSRNRYLSADERTRALSISRALFAAREEVEKGVRQTNRLMALMQNTILSPGNVGHVPVAIDYVAAVDPQTLRPMDLVKDSVLLAIAARVGTTRLIDNIQVDIHE